MLVGGLARGDGGVAAAAAAAAATFERLATVAARCGAHGWLAPLARRTYATAVEKKGVVWQSSVPPLVR